MIILGIETSCDETALALIEAENDTGATEITVLGEELFSQVEIHKPFGGVFPTMAKREHARNLIPLMKKLLGGIKVPISNSQFLISNQRIHAILAREPELLKQFLEFIPTIEKPKIDKIAVTYGPGLEPALWVGINFAFALKEVWDIPVIPINHMEGHIASALLKRVENVEQNGTNAEGCGKETARYTLNTLQFPAVALLISGGHTELIVIKDWMRYEIVGQTRDDAVGEAFDKVARILGLPYPGGPYISALAEISRTNSELTRNNPEKIMLPRPMMKSDNLDFSFSGLKTAVLYMVKKIPTLTEGIKQEIAKEFENAVTDVLLSKTKKAIETYGAKTLLLGGGVIANAHIRGTFETLGKKLKIPVYIPNMNLTTDNALMIASAGFFHTQRGEPSQEWENVRAIGNLRLAFEKSQL